MTPRCMPGIAGAPGLRLPGLFLLCFLSLLSLQALHFGRFLPLLGFACPRGVALAKRLKADPALAATEIHVAFRVLNEKGFEQTLAALAERAPDAHALLLSLPPASSRMTLCLPSAVSPLITNSSALSV